MAGLTPLDYTVIVLFLGVNLSIGLWAMHGVRNREDFFLGGRRFGKLFQTFAAFGQATSAETIVSVSTATMRNGASGVWANLLALFSTPVYWMTSPWYRRMRVLTLGDFFEERYESKSLGVLYALTQSVFLMIAITLSFTAITKTTMALTAKPPAEFTKAEQAEYLLALELDQLEAASYTRLSDAEKARLEELRLREPRKTFSYFRPRHIVVAVGVITLIYSAAGGLAAAVATQLIQGVFIIVLSLLPLPFALQKINAIYGGNSLGEAFKIMHEQLPESHFEVFGSAFNIDFTWYYIAAISLLQVVSVAVLPNQLTAIASAKDEYTSRFGFVVGNFIKRFCTVLWGVFALTATLLYSKSIGDTDLVLGHATGDLLGPLNLGLPGLMVACLVAAMMSSVSCWMMSGSGLLTQNFYRVAVPGRSERHYVIVGRIAGSVIVLGGMLMALRLTSIFAQLKLLWEFPLVFAAPFWLGILWRKTTRAAAWATVAGTLLFFFVLPAVLPIVLPSLRTAPYLAQLTDARVVQSTYLARASDVEQRQKEIEVWQATHAEGDSAPPRPAELQPGQEFTRSYTIPRKSLFWTQGLRVREDGVLEGQGRLNLEMALLAKSGVPLCQWPYALNETVRTLLRVFLPFFAIVLLSFLTPKISKPTLDRFYVRMKTPVNTDLRADRREVQLSYANPTRFDHKKMFPNSELEFCMWSKEDVVGFVAAWLAVAGVIALLVLLVSIGS